MDTIVTYVIGDAALVFVVASLLGALARRCGQPTVVGQILAGLLFGSSLLGRLPGHLTSRLFPPAALPYLTVISQIAVAIFMFVVGYELNRQSLARGRSTTLLVAGGALLIPMGLGSGAVLAFRRSFAAIGQSHISHSFILFMGVATAITALPVLAAIMRERGIAGTTAGVTATAAAGIMDVIAWVVLAAALVGTRHQPGHPWPVTLGLIAAFVVVMLAGVRPAVRWWMRRSRTVLTNQLPVALGLTLGSAWVTASLGVHPVFGGLLAGLTMPSMDGTPDPDVLRPMEDVSSVLLPLFFVVTGLSVNIGALGGTALLLLAVLFTAASAGKLGAGYVGARVGGLDRKDSATVAALLNTRGLTELIALNIGLSSGLIGDRLFSILVVMAVLTTLMTAPLLKLIRPVTTPPVTTPPVMPAPQSGFEPVADGFPER